MQHPAFARSRSMQRERTRNDLAKQKSRAQKVRECDAGSDDIYRHVRAKESCRIRWCAG